jgi:hypothetical protein
MSGWIKIERSLKTDIRFGKAAKKLDLKRIFDAAVALPERYLALRQTLLLGALAQLWLHADEHVGEDDILRGSVDDIDELIGVDQLCQSLPADWLQVVDPDHIKLTDFVSHNGTSARSRKLNADRQARFRDRQRGLNDTTESNANITLRNASNASKQTKQTKQISKRQNGAERPPACRLPDDFLLTEERKAYAKSQHIDPAKTFENFTDYWRSASGSRARKHDWGSAWRMWCRKESERGSLNGNGRQHRGNDSAAWAEARSHAKAIGFRDPDEREALGAYTTAIRQYETAPRNPLTAGEAAPKVAALTAKFRAS